MNHLSYILFGILSEDRSWKTLEQIAEKSTLPQDVIDKALNREEFGITSRTSQTGDLEFKLSPAGLHKSKEIFHPETQSAMLLVRIFEAEYLLNTHNIPEFWFDFAAHGGTFPVSGIMSWNPSRKKILFFEDFHLDNGRPAVEFGVPLADLSIVEKLAFCGAMKQFLRKALEYRSLISSNLVRSMENATDGIKTFLAEVSIND